MLVVALGLVLALMHQLRQPNASRQLDQLFPGQGPSANSEFSDRFVLSSGTPVEPENDQPPESLPIETEEALSRVKDNTYFRSEEHAAWFALFARLQKMDDQQLQNQSPAELTYAQLLAQPAWYRGRLVTIRGTVLREEVVPAPENALGIQSYHRLWLRPAGGGQWPFVVYCLKLPENFPRGDRLRAAVSVTGFFFKNWSYAWKDGLGLAPVVLARGLDWQRAAARPLFRPVAWQSLAWGIACAGVLAAAATWLAMRRTQPGLFTSAQNVAGGTLPVPDASVDEEVKQQLQRLAEEGEGP